MATNKPTGDNARKGAVKKRSRTKTIMGDATIWTKRDKAAPKRSLQRRRRPPRK
ncbi:hypothetical protein [Tardiphaga sp. P9-11]|uniref:hypothetical protein n=1 Tax=Tardiphaga sp. P9-11 TaxID=2024614 RepID=UPI0015626390|nr:hypothetical protein [Tardiphaga sp. P9-11]